MWVEKLTFATVIVVPADRPSRVGGQTSNVTRHSRFDRAVVNLPRTRSDNKRLSLFVATHVNIELPERRLENGVITRVGIMAH